VKDGCIRLAPLGNICQEGSNLGRWASTSWWWWWWRVINPGLGGRTVDNLFVVSGLRGWDMGNRGGIDDHGSHDIVLRWVPSAIGFLPIFFTKGAREIKGKVPGCRETCGPTVDALRSAWTYVVRVVLLRWAMGGVVFHCMAVATDGADNDALGLPAVISRVA